MNDCDKCKAQAAELEAARLHIKHIGNDALRKENHELQAKLSALESQHTQGKWCVDLTCNKCYSADFRFKHAAPVAQPAEKRPINCGTGYCSCIECPYENKP